MTIESAVLSFALVAALMTITPGIDTALVLRTSAIHGRRAGFAAALGINVGVLIWGIAAAVGVSALLTASEVAYTALRYLGAAYMLWLGFKLLSSALRRSPRADAVAEEPTASPRGWSHFRQGVLVNLMNPKIGAFYVALLPQFIPAEASPALMGALLAVVHNLEGLLWFALLIFAVDRMRAVLARPAAQRWIDGIAGATIVGFGVKLGLSRS